MLSSDQGLNYFQSWLKHGKKGGIRRNCTLAMQAIDFSVPTAIAPTISINCLLPFHLAFASSNIRIQLVFLNIIIQNSRFQKPDYWIYPVELSASYLNNAMQKITSQTRNLNVPHFTLSFLVCSVSFTSYDILIRYLLY